MYIESTSLYVGRNFSQSFAIFQYQFDDILNGIKLLTYLYDFVRWRCPGDDVELYLRMFIAVFN